LGYNTYIHGSATRKPLCSYLKQAKMSLFLNKIGEQDGGIAMALEWGLVPVGGGGGGEMV
jgi:hypothetical protein